MTKTLIYSVIFLVIALGIPRILRLWNGNTGSRSTAMERARTQIVFQGLHMHLKPLLANKKNTTLRVAIGYNSNVDLILDALALMNQFAQDHNIESVAPHDHIVIGNFTELFQSFAEYFAVGGAVERFIADKQVFDAIVKDGGALNSSHYHIGGNAALMGLYLHQQAWQVLLAGAIGPKLRQLLEEHQDKSKPAIQYASSSSAPHAADEDEVHVIMVHAIELIIFEQEYSKGATFLNKFTAPRANRYIATRDIANAEFLSLNEFHKKMPEFNPHLLVLSGFHLMDGQDKDKRNVEWDQITKYLKLVKNVRFMHVELASIGTREIYKEIADNVFASVNSLGLNEQELGSLYNVLFPEQKKLLNISQTIPDIQQVYTALVAIMQAYPTLSRVHFHCLAYQFVAINKASGTAWGASQKQKVQGAMAAASASSLTATTRACGFASHLDVLSNLNHVEMLVDLNKLMYAIRQGSNGKNAILNNHSVLSWSDGADLELFVAPVLVCKKPTKTVGLGDAISASGVSAQVQWLVYDL